MVLFYPGVAGKRPGKSKGVVLHDDAGSKYANAAFYKGWLPNHQAENGFAHVYMASDGRYQAENYDNIAWHTGNSEGNTWYVGWEVCQSMGDEATYRANLQKTYEDIAKYMKSEGMTPNNNTVRLHREFSATACPHRAWELLGKSINAVKAVHIAGILKAMGQGGTVTPSPSPSPSKPQQVTVKPWNVTQIVDVNGLNIRVAQNTKAQSIGTLNKGATFNATRIAENGENVNGYTTWFEVNGSGWVSGAFVTPVATSTPTSTTPSKPAATAPTTGKWWSEKGKFYIGEATPGATNANIKSLPLTVNATGNGAKIADIAKGNYIQYDMAMNDGKYIWIRQPRANGTFGYMATGNVKNGKRVDYWGRFR